MTNRTSLIPLILGSFLAFACNESKSTEETSQNTQEDTTSVTTLDDEMVKPLFVTEPTKYDTDDPAIWYNAADPAQSLIIGTDKNQDGALYVYDLEGRIIADKTVSGLQRPNNVDITYGFQLGDSTVDIAVTTERNTHKLRIFALPSMQAVDGGGIPVFEGETEEGFRDLMGIALYKNPQDDQIYAIVGRKNGPKQGYLWQYLLEDDGTGQVTGTLARKFGNFSQKKEIEAIAVDDNLGYVYYSDEGTGIRKYYADPKKGNEELALFGTEGFADDHEGISIYQTSDSTGFILVSDQQANAFHVFRREGERDNPNQHQLYKVVKTSTVESDGSEVIHLPLNEYFKKGMFVAMSDDKTFQIYRWEDLGIE